MARTPKGPWWRKSHGAWYCKIGGRQVRLDVDHTRAVERFRALTAQPKAEGVTVAKLVDLYLDARRAEVATHTIELYGSHGRSFARVAGDLPASDVRPLHVSAWITARGIGPNTARMARRIVKQIWRWGAAEGHVPANPLASVVAGTVGRRREVSGDDVDAWIAAIDRPALRDWCDVSLGTGARPGELVGLEWRDVDETQRVAQVAGKTGRRPLYLTPAVLETLHRLAEVRPTGPLLRTPSWKRPWNLNSLDYAFRRHSERCGITIVPYDLRHEFATRLTRKGVPDSTVAKLMGHASTAMVVRHYLRHDSETLLAALDRT